MTDKIKDRGQVIQELSDVVLRLADFYKEKKISKDSFVLYMKSEIKLSIDDLAKIFEEVFKK